MNCNPPDVVIRHFALAGVEPRADFNAKGPNFLGNGTGTTNTSGWSVKRGKNTVAGRFDLMTAKACEIAPDRGVMIVEQIVPATVSQRGGFLGRADDVSEEHCREHPVYLDRRPRTGQKLFYRVGNLIGIVANPWWMIFPRKFDVASAGNVF
jgi:hypothetical protein